jgi:polyvinyl alcohol dehydrogenase (cytochrome)
MSTYNEALVVLRYDGTLSWAWRPREVDNDDLAFGAAPNLFTATIKAQDREVVGIGGKDGTYYLLDRDGENEITGQIEPYWKTNVVPGGAIGGIQGTPAIVGDRIIFAVGIGEKITAVQKPTGYALDAATGSIVWQSDEMVPFFGATSAVPGVIFTGGIDFSMHAHDAATGELLFTHQLGGVVSSQAVVVDGVLYIGSGFGAASAGGGDTADIAAQLARAPAAVWAFCVQGEEDCEGVQPTATP